MVDRFADLNPFASEEDNEESDEGGGSQALDSFFHQVNVIKDNLSMIKEATDQIRALTAARLVEVDASKEEQRGGELDSLIDKCNGAIGIVRNKLKEIDQMNSDNGGGSDIEHRTRVNMYATLSKKFTTLIREYQEVQSEAKMSYEDRLIREVRIVRPEVSNEEVQKMLQGDDAGRIFQQSMLGDVDHSQAKQNLLFISERHKDIMKLEKSIRELHRLFVDMAALVAAQGELIDQIEHSVSMSVQYTGKGVEELEVAIKHQKCGRKKKCILIIIMCCVLVAILLPVIITQVT